MPLFADVCFLAPLLARSLEGEKFKWDVKTRKVPCVVERWNRRLLAEIYFYYRSSNICVKSDVLRTEGKPVFTGHNSGIKLDALSAPRLTFNIVILPEFVWVLPETDRRECDTKARRAAEFGPELDFPHCYWDNIWYIQKWIYNCARPGNINNAETV